MKTKSEKIKVLTKMQSELDKVNCEEYSLEIKFKDKTSLHICKEVQNKEKEIGFNRGGE